MLANREAPSAPSGMFSKGRGAVATCCMLLPLATPTVMPFVTNVFPDVVDAGEVVRSGGIEFPRGGGVDMSGRRCGG